MSALERLKTIGGAAPGTRALVCDGFDAVDAARGGTVHLPIGTQIEINYGTGGSISAVADMGGRLQRVYIFAEQFHCIEVAP